MEMRKWDDLVPLWDCPRSLHFTLLTDEWYIELQRVTTGGTSNDNEWQQLVQRVTTNGNDW